MSSHFSALGFDIEGDAFDEFAAASVEHAQYQPAGVGTYGRWNVGEGIEIWLALHDGNLLGLNPMFRGAGAPHRMRITSAAGDAEVLGLEGMVTAHHVADELHIPWPLDVVNFAEHEDLEGATVDVAICGFAHGLERRERSGSAARESRSAARAGAPSPQEVEAFFGEAIMGAGPRLADEAFVPVGMFDEYEPEALAMVSGVVRHARELANPHTGEHFHHLVLATPGCDLDVVADAWQLEALPTIGDVIAGELWLAACVDALVER